MPIPSFTSGYPPDGSSLGQTKSTIRDNLDGTFQTLAIDHFDNNNANAGKHKFSHYVSGADATTGAGEGALYCKTPTSGTNLFWRFANNNANILQVTNGYFSNSANCIVPLMAGMIMQCGFIASAGLNTPVLFHIPFDVLTVPYSISLTGRRAASDPGGTDAWVVSGSITNAGFTIFNSGNHTFDGWYWTAIGTKA